MTYRNLLLLGLSSIALQGCIAAAAIPIVAGGGALVRDSVSDDARAGSRERVTVVPTAPVAAPAPAPSPAPTPALAAAQPAEAVSVAAEPMPEPAPTPAPLATPLATPAAEPIAVATLGNAPQGPELPAVSAPTPVPAETPPAQTTAIAAPQLPPEPDSPASNAVIVMTLPAGWEEPTAEPVPPSQAAVAANLPEEPVAAAIETSPAIEPEPEPGPASIADVGLPPEPVAAETEPAPAPALATAAPSTEPVAAEPEQAAAPALATATPIEEPVSAQPDVPEPLELAAVEPADAAVTGASDLAATSVEAPAPAIPAPVTAPAPAPEPAPVEDALVSAPPPAQPPAAAVMPFQPTGEGHGALRNYTLATLGGGLPLPSAMLADPTSLQPIRRQCQGNAPTVVIDLDPAGSLVPLVGPLALNSDLGRILDELRMRDVQIAWITDRGPIDARRVRDRLVAAGLDPDGQDALYVERYPGETKQARRAALAQTQCVIALAGDEPSDFDDLYNYIIDSDDARSLNPMLGNGWFLIDNPVGQ